MATARATEFCCVRCPTTTLVEQQAELRCHSCGTVYPIVHGVPILFADVVVEPTAPPQLEAIVTAVSAYQALPTDQTTRDTLKAIFSKRYRFSDFLLDAESQQYLDRIHHDQSAPTAPSTALQGLRQLKRTLKPFIPAPLQQKIRQLQAKLRQWPEAKAASPTPIGPLRSVRYAWVGDYLPRTMLAKHCFTGNVRLQNRGDQALPHRGPNPVMLSYHWRQPNGDRVNGLTEHHSPLPIDLPPGQAVTIPMMIETPAIPGDYQLQLCLVEEHIAWHETDATTIAIAITAAPPAHDPTATWQTQAQVYSYHDDHIRAIEQLKQQLQTVIPHPPKILEVGGNACPMLFHDFSGELYNLDIDVHGLQIGKLMDQYVRPDANRMHFICADANQMPFPDAYFDCITMFASLHHFPDLRAILRSLAQKIQPDGFLAMLCEPVGHHYGMELDPTFRAELLKGVNEQSFSLAEYAAIFADAGLVVDRVIVDAFSLKAFLKKPTTPT